MLKTLVLILCVATAGLAMSCSKDNSSDTTNNNTNEEVSIVGEWLRVTRDGETYYDPGELPLLEWRTFFVFTADGRFSREASVRNTESGSVNDFVELTGTYIISGKKLIVSYYDENDEQNVTETADLEKLTKEEVVIVSEAGDKVYFKRV